MNQVNRQYVKEQQLNVLLRSPWVKLLGLIKKTDPLKLIWWCLAVSIISGTLSRYVSETSGIIFAVLVVLGSGGCAWFWLLSRCLFNDDQVLHSKAILWVPAVIVLEAMAALLPEVSTNQTAHEIYRVFTNVASMICVAAIVFVFNEALSGFSKIRAKLERRFRIVFLVIFSIPVAIAVFWVMGAEAETLAGEWNDMLLTFCGLLSLVGSRVALAYRLRTSEIKSFSSTSMSDERNQIEALKRVADQVQAAINNDDLLTRPNLKVSDLAEHLNQQEYKVTRSITNHLNYRNFNHMVNKHRIERALKILKDPENKHLKIATIAFGCGYNSLGPFNRAFKTHTGMTPRHYRKELSL